MGRHVPIDTAQGPAQERRGGRGPTKKTGKPSARKTGKRSATQREDRSEDDVLAKFNAFDSILKLEIQCIQDPPLHRLHRWGGMFDFFCEQRIWRSLKY